MPFDIDRTHPLAIGLRSLWLPAQDAGESLLRNLAGGSAAGVLDTMAFPATAGERPTWGVGQPGVGLDFDGSNDYLARTTNLPWQPLTEGGDLTVAVYAEIFAYPTSSTVEMWSSQYAPGTSDRVIATLGLRASTGTVRARICLNEAGGSSGETTIAWPALRTPFLVIFTSRGQNDHEMAVFAPGAGVPSFVTDVTSRQPLASFNPTSEVIGNEIYAGTPDAPFNGRIYGVWTWNRGLSRPDLTSFLMDPFAMLAPKRVSGGVGFTSAVDGQAVATTLATQWLLSAGTATAGASVPGRVLSNTWSLTPGVALAPNSGLAPGRTLATTWQVIGGAAAGASPSGGVTIATAWSLTTGPASATATAPGATLTTQWSVATPSATQARELKYIGGGGFGPGASPALRRKVRNAMRKAQASLDKVEFWPDPDDLSPEELEEWAKKAEAALADPTRQKGETPEEFAHRMAQEVERFLLLQEKQNHDALILLMVQ